MTRIAFVILSYNSLAEAALLARRIRDAIGAHLLVLVDNASPDRTGYAEWTSLAGGNVHCIESRSNDGYSAGNNIGIDHAIKEGIENVVVLNPDVSIENVQHFVTVLEDHFERDDFLCLAINVRNVVPYYTPITLASLMLPGIARILDRLRHATSRLRAGGDTRPVGRIHGCAFALRARTFRQLGLLDEALFLYAEEAVVSIVARRAGKAILQTTRAEVIHGIDAEHGALDLAPYRWLRRSLSSILRRYYGWPAFLATGAAYVPIAQLLAFQLASLAASRLRR